jgi:hypothetical protein
MRISKRIALSAAAAALLTLSFSGIAFAEGVHFKTIDTVNGQCMDNNGHTTAACSSAATYGANGFTGAMIFNHGGAAHIPLMHVWDYICAHKPTDGSGTFNTIGGTYHLSLYTDSTFSTLLGPTPTATYTVGDGLECHDAKNQADPNSTGLGGATVQVPDCTVTNPSDPNCDSTHYPIYYSLTIDGLNSASFAAYDTIQNNAHTEDPGTYVARTGGVLAPTSFIVPEAPFAVLLPLSAGLLAAAFVMRRSRSATRPVA